MSQAREKETKQDFTPVLVLITIVSIAHHTGHNHLLIVSSFCFLALAFVVRGLPPTLKMLWGVLVWIGHYQYIYKGFLNFGKKILKKFWKV